MFDSRQTIREKSRIKTERKDRRENKTQSIIHVFCSRVLIARAPDMTHLFCCVLTTTSSFLLPCPLCHLHLLSRVQHVDIAALLIKYNTCVNATDKWAFTPLHEAAQKGRTQLCALLLAHGADPTMKNQEGQTPLDLATVGRLSLKLWLNW